MSFQNHSSSTSDDLQQSLRQQLFSTLANANLKDIQGIWNSSIDCIDFEYIRQPEVGMVMAVGRTGMTGEPFNLGEVTVTRCAVKLASGETGFGYVKGRNKTHSTHIAVIDALAQTDGFKAEIYTQLIHPLHEINREKILKQQAYTDKTKVDFFTMVRGEDDND